MTDILTPWQTILDAGVEHASEIVLAAPYIKVGALRKLLQMIKAEIHIVCVSRWTPEDVITGATDIQVKRTVEEIGGTFRLYPSLHAKYYRFDDRTFVGSANLTQAALGYARGANLEILCPPGKEFNASRFEQELIVESRLVSDEEMSTWEALLQLPRDKPFHFGVEESNWRPFTRDPEYVWLAYAGTPEQIIDAEQLPLALEDLRRMRVPLGLSRETFNLCVRACLLSCPFVNAVLQHNGHSDDEEFRLQIASTWGISERDAARAIETANFWLVAFL